MIHVDRNKINKLKEKEEIKNIKLQNSILLSSLATYNIELEELKLQNSKLLIEAAINKDNI